MQFDIDRTIAAQECPQEFAAIEAELAGKRPGLNVATIQWSYWWAVQLPQHSIVMLSLTGRDQRREASRQLGAQPASFQQHLLDLKKPRAPLQPDEPGVMIINARGQTQIHRLLGGYSRVAGGKEKYRRLVLENTQTTSVSLYTITSRHEVLYAGGFQPATRERFFAANEGDEFKWKSLRMIKLPMADVRASVDLANPVRCTDIDRN